MALEHALMVALREQPASGLELAKRFSRSIGFFWSATHQQIYRVLARMERDGWVRVTEVSQSGRPDKKVYDVTPAGSEVLTSWLAEPADDSPLRSEVVVKMRGASFGDRAEVVRVVETELADHHLRLEHFQQLQARDYPDPAALTGLHLDHHLVLRGGIAMEQTWITFLTDYLEAHR